MATTKATAVYVFRCSRCGLEYLTLTGRKPVAACGRCHNTFLPIRRIGRPHDQTVAQAEREDAGRSAE